MDLIQTNHPAGDTEIEKCMSECNENSKCSAFEWYTNGWSGSKCKLMLGVVPAAKGWLDTQWNNATCHIKPSHGKV